MAPKPLEDLRRYVEQTQSQLEDPAERERALGVIERELNDTLGRVRTYRNEAQLQRGADTERDSDGADRGASGASQGTTPPPTESS
jgi:hypothetical protein